MDVDFLGTSGGGGEGADAAEEGAADVDAVTGESV